MKIKFAKVVPGEVGADNFFKAVQAKVKEAPADAVPSPVKVKPKKSAPKTTVKGVVSKLVKRS